MAQSKRYVAYRPILGKTFLDRQTDDTRYPVLQIGADRWSRARFAETFGIPNTQAAGKITGVAKTLGVKNVEDLYRRTSAMSFAQSGIGVTTLYVLFHVFAAKGLNVQQWYLGGSKQAIRTFTTIKKRDADGEARIRKAAKRASKK